MNTSDFQTSLYIRLFGGFEAFRNDAPLPATRTCKERWLLAVLILRHATPVERTWLACLFWPDSIEERALQNLRRSLNNLRQSLGADAFRLIAPTPRTLRFDVSGMAIDVLDFDAALARGDRTGREEAIALYRGALLEGCHEDWLLTERARREAAYLQALETLAEEALARTDTAGAIRLLRRILVVEPGREAAFCTLMRALAASGDTGGMVEAYRDFRRYLHTELNMGPAPETTALYHRLRAEMKLPPKVRDSIERPHGSLPSPLTRLIGREREMAEAVEWLHQPGVRLVTITGFGGMGKTRLAMQVAEQSLPAFPDGVWWLEMQEETSGEAMLARIAERLRLSVPAGASLREQIHQALRARNLLLVLDCLEQIPDAAETVRDLLAAAPGVRCLTTSRRVLGLRGEHVLELLPLPEADARALFVERVREVKADFAEDDANQKDIAELCRRLEGVPLALELAAARSVLLTPRQILDRLNERFRLLHSHSPDLPPRQRALYTVIEWSYYLLPEKARAVLAQLSVFFGGFTLEDAETVCGRGELFEWLETLRRHSFFRVETDTVAQVSRLFLLDSVREYAAERLQETADGGVAFYRRHAERFLRQARAQLACLRTPGESAALYTLEADGANLRAAAQWAREAGESPLASELALALGQWRHRRGFMQEAIAAIQSGLDALPAHTSFALREELLRERAGLHLDFREMDAARERAEEALTLSVAQGDRSRQAKAENLLGQAAMYEANFAEARERFGRALEQFTQAQQNVEVANVRTNLGVAERRDSSGSPAERAGRLEAAEAHLQEALRLRRVLQDRRGLAETLNSLGVLAYERGEMERAEGFYREALAYQQEVWNTLEAALLISNLGEVAEKRQEAVRALRQFAVAERLLEQVQSPLQSVVAEMARRTATDGGLSSEVVSALRTEIESLPITECVDFALAAEPDPQTGRVPLPFVTEASPGARL